MLQCTQCNQDLQKPIICISGSQFGDENTDCYYFCSKCGVYTLEHELDVFGGETSSTFEGPVNIEDGEKAIALIQKCTEPWNKKCRCPVHMEYFRGNLD